eukprot:478331_1
MRFYIMTKQYKLANQWYLTGHAFLKSCKKKFETGSTGGKLILIVNNNEAHKYTLEIWYSYLLSCTNRNGLMHLLENVYIGTNWKGLRRPKSGSSSSHFYALTMATTSIISYTKQSKYYQKWIMSSGIDINDIG